MDGLHLVPMSADDHQTAVRKQRVARAEQVMFRGRARDRARRGIDHERSGVRGHPPVPEAEAKRAAICQRRDVNRRRTGRLESDLAAAVRRRARHGLSPRRLRTMPRPPLASRLREVVIQTRTGAGDDLEITSAEVALDKPHDVYLAAANVDRSAPLVSVVAAPVTNS